MKKDTSWEKDAKSYGEAVGKSGHYYHKNVIFPRTKKLLKLKKTDRLIDFGCGSAPILSLFSPGKYLGIDTSNSLIRQGKKNFPKAQFLVQDACKKLTLDETFTHATFFLSLQNMQKPEMALENAKNALVDDGVLYLVLNHPSFRIPRHSSWVKDLKNKKMERKIDAYLSSMKIPIEMHPGKKDKTVTYSFHRPLSFYSKTLYELGFFIELIDEWCSDKKSTGKYAKMEDRARDEFPLFMVIKARKLCAESLPT